MGGLINRLSMELMELVKAYGIEVTGVVKAYVKACVIALQIQLDCIDRVCILTVGLSVGIHGALLVCEKHGAFLHH